MLGPFAVGPFEDPLGALRNMFRSVAILAQVGDDRESECSLIRVLLEFHVDMAYAGGGSGVCNDFRHSHVGRIGRGAF